jgi:hypothetical protein
MRSWSESLLGELRMEMRNRSLYASRENCGWKQVTWEVCHYDNPSLWSYKHMDRA